MGRRAEDYVAELAAWLPRAIARHGDRRQRFIAVMKLAFPDVLSGIFCRRAVKAYRCRISGRDVFSVSCCRKRVGSVFFQLAGVWPHIE